MLNFYEKLQKTLRLSAFLQAWWWFGVQCYDFVSINTRLIG